LSSSEGRKVYQIRALPAPAATLTVAYYVDDASYPIPGNNIAPLARTFDVDRVEVLRGPQGTLYGQGAMGGSIRFLTADPDSNRIKARVQGGAYLVNGGDPGYFGDAALSLPLVEDKFAVRLVVGREHKGGYADIQQFISDQYVNEADITNIRVKALFKPSATVKIHAMYQRSEIEQEFGGALDSANPPLLISTGRNSFTNNSMDQFSGSINIDMNFASIENSIGKIKYNLSQDNEFGSKFGPGGAKVPIPVISETDAGTFSDELRLVSRGAGSLQWIIGVYYQNSFSEL